jgi:hypothetical protein
MQHPPVFEARHQNPGKIRNGPAINHAVRLIHAVCGLAGSATLIDDIRADLRADKVQAAIRHRDTAVTEIVEPPPPRRQALVRPSPAACRRFDEYVR